MKNDEEQKKLIEITETTRLSDAYPPGSTNNTEYLSDVHYKLKTAICKSEITYREIKFKQDIDQLKMLHKEWFPINYTDSFYEMIYKNSQYSLVAEIQTTYQSGRKENVIIGALLFKIKNQKEKYIKQTCLEKISNYLNLQENFAIYIMTLGVVNEYRGQGVAQTLLNNIKNLVLNNQKLQYIYLDMVDYNQVAGKFYQKNGFSQIKIKQNYYTIEDKKYNALVYVWYKDNKKIQVAKQSEESQILKLLQLPYILIKSIVKKFQQEKQ